LDAGIRSKEVNEKFTFEGGRSFSIMFGSSLEDFLSVSMSESILGVESANSGSLSRALVTN